MRGVIAVTEVDKRPGDTAGALSVHQGMSPAGHLGAGAGVARELCNRPS